MTCPRSRSTSTWACDLITVEVAPQPSRPGRPFAPKAEADLGDALRVAASHIRTPMYDLSVLVSEAALPSGVADLVVMRTRSAPLAARLNADILAITSRGDLGAVAACLQRFGATEDVVAKSTSETLGHARRRLRQLEANGAVRHTGERWVAHPSLDLKCSTYALEAKVSDWRAGVWQALRYRTWCDGSALVVGALTERVEAAARAAAKDVRVGLYASGRWVVRPRVEAHDRATRLAVSERLVWAIQSSAATQDKAYQMLSASA